MLLQKLLEGLSLVGGGIIQEDDHRALQMAQQGAEKRANLLLPDVVEVKLIVQAQALSLGAYGNSGNDRDLVAPTLAVIVNRSTPLRRPGLGHIRNKEEARFVGKD
jgi:hypothetical protein